jgi:uncharacterized membrane protein
LPAADFAKQGKDRYNAGDYAGAVDPLTRAVELEPNNFDYKLALAHALAKSNQCGRARPMYSELAATADATRKPEVDAGLASCPAPEATPPPSVPATPEPPPTTTAVVTSGGGTLGKGPMFMLMGGGALVGAGVILLFAGYTHAGDADDARSVSDHDRIAGRATTEYVLGGIGIAAGVALSLWAMHTINKSSEHETTVGVTAHNGGGGVVLGGSW